MIGGILATRTRGEAPPRRSRAHRVRGCPPGGRHGVGLLSVGVVWGWGGGKIIPKSLNPTDRTQLSPAVHLQTGPDGSPLGA